MYSVLYLNSITLRIKDLKSVTKHDYTPEGLERDDTEVEINSNINEIHSGLSRLKMMGIAMNQEMDLQSDQLKRIDARTNYTRGKVDKLNRKVDQIVERKR